MYDSIDVARAAIRVALTPSRQEEEHLVAKLRERGLKAAAVDVGGNITDTIHIVIERAILVSRKCGILEASLVNDGAIAGAAREAIMQVSQKVSGLNGGGKIGICRGGEHLSVCIFMSAGMLHLNEVVIGLGHRAVAADEK